MIIVFSEELTKISSYAFSSLPALESVIIPNSVIEIGSNAFSDCHHLKNVKLSEDLISMGYRAFYNCLSLEEITIPQNLTMSNETADDNCGWWFENCRGLKKIEFEDGATIVPARALEGAMALEKVVLPDTLSTIDRYAFAYCYSLREIALPKLLTSIGVGAFNYSGLQEITIPKNVTYIGESGAFQESDLQTVEFADGIKEVPKFMFEGIHSLSEVIIPQSVSTIRSNAFNSCEGLKVVTYAGTAEQYAEITVETGNDYFKNANVYCMTPTVSPREEAKKNVTLFIEINQGELGGADDYIKCTQANITLSGNIYSLDEEGKVELPTSGTAIIGVDGYNKRSINLSSVSNGDIIRLEKIDPNATPIVYGITINGKDAKNKKYQMTEDFVGRISANVDWNGGEAGTIYVENNGNKWKMTNGQTAEVDFGKKIDFNKKTYLVATSAAGKTVKKQIDLEFLKIDLPTNASVSLDSVSNVGEVPTDGIPYFNGFKLKFSIPNFPVSFSASDGKVIGIIGVDVRRYKYEHDYGNSAKLTVTHNDYKKISDIIKNTKNQMEKNKADKKKLSQQYTELKNKLGNSQNKMTGKLGFDAAINMCGYIEATVTNGKLEILNAGMIFSGETTANVGGNLMLWVIPFNWEVTVSGKVSSQLGLSRATVAEAMTPYGIIALELKGSIGAGPGTKNVHVNCCGALGIKPTISSSTEKVELTVDYEAECYLETKLGKLVYKFDLKSTEGRLYPAESKAKTAALMSVDDIYDTEKYTLIKRPSENGSSDFVANSENGMALQSLEYSPSSETTIKTNVFSNAAPKIYPMGGTKKLLIWSDDDTTRSNINGSSLMYTYYDGKTWTAPAYVENDGTSDFNPRVRTINDVTYLVWENCKEALEDDTGIEKMVKSYEIKYAIYDKATNSFTNITTLTDNAYYDFLPVINNTSKGAVISWVSNKGELFTTDNCYSIEYANVKGAEVLSNGTVAENLSAIDSQVVFVKNDKFEALYVVDTDGDITTGTDNILYSTADKMTVLDHSVSGIYETYGKVYCYYDGIVAVSSDYKKFTETKLAVPNCNFFVTDNGNAVFYEVVGENNCEVYAYFYSNNSWSEPVKVVSSDSLISDISGLKDSNGKYVVAYTKGLWGTTEEALEISCTDLAVATISPAYNLSLTSIFIDREKIIPGETVQIFADVTNMGTKSVNKVDITLYNGMSMVTTETVTQTILLGETVQVTLNYQIPDGFTAFDGTVEVLPNGQDDCDISDNTYKISLNYTDISLDQLSYSKKLDNTWEINAAISNLGFEAENNIEVKLKLGEQVLETKNVQSLNVLETKGVVFSVNEENVEYVVEISELKDEDNIVNNGGTITIEKAVLEPEYVVGDLNGDGEVTDSDAIYLMYYTFFPEDYPISQDCDFDGDGEVTDNDAVYLMYYTFFPEDYPLLN